MNPRTHCSHIAALIALVFLTGFSSQTPAAASDGALRMEVITAYNFVVDSNIESPAGRSPSAAHLGVKVYNDGSEPMTNVVVNIGNLIDASNHIGTPGTFAARTIAEEDPLPYAGTFALQMPGGVADAIRVIPRIEPGQYVAQYFFVTYPLKDASNRSVAGAAPVVTDDLWLEYDIWAQANDGNGPLRVDKRTRVTMRNEISAMANKIWPNGDNKVPTQYLDAIEASLGWRPQQFVPRIEGASMVEGIWYDLGNVGAGFDNNGDGIPDRNAWMQPVGNPELFSPLAARMVKSYGLVIVKLNDGTEQLIPFEDQLYFENIPANNTGAVGLVYYEFLPLNTSLPSQMTPYQEVASGYDNEKFNADYGRAVGEANNNPPVVNFDKSGPEQVSKGGEVTYSLTATNLSTGTTNFGWPELALPAVIEDSVPSGLEYVAGSATSANVPPPGQSFTVTWSTDGGATWSAIEPATGTTGVSIRWTLSGSLGTDSTAPDQNNMATVTFKAIVPSGYTGLSIDNTGCLKTGTETSYACDTATTRVLGENVVGDLVWRDIDRDGVLDVGEPGLPNIGVSLYFDADNDGILDSGEPLYATTSTGASGQYRFEQLPDGRYIVVVNNTDSDLPYGLTLAAATNRQIAINLDAASAISGSVSVLNADWPFIAALDINKSVAPTTYNEGALVTYTIDLDNNMSPLQVANPSVQTVYATSIIQRASGQGSGASVSANIAGVPDNAYGFLDWEKSSDEIETTAIQTFPSPTGNITKVELIIRGYLTTLLQNDSLAIQINRGSGFANLPAPLSPRTAVQLNTLVGVPQDLVIDITSLGGWNWTLAQALRANLISTKAQANDRADYYIDSIGFRVTTDSAPVTGSFGPNSILELPLKDTYDPLKLRYLSASIAPDRTTPAGTLEWDNLGPLNPGTRKTLTVTFRALPPSDTSNPSDGRRDATIATNTITTQNVSTGGVPRFASGLPAGHDTSAVNVTINPAGTIGNLVFWDANANGSIDSGEIPLSGVIVFLWRHDGSNWISTGSTAITDSNGFYSFSDLADGTYQSRIVVDPTSGLFTLPWTTFTATGIPGVVNTPIAPSSTTNATFVFGATVVINNSDFVAANDSNENQDFGFDSNAASLISGKLFMDHNANGTQDSGEEALAGYIIRLTPPSGPVVNVSTDANGFYAFNNLGLTGGYTVAVLAPPSGTSQTLDPDGLPGDNQTLVSVSPGNAYTGRNFAYRPSGAFSIGDTVFYDWNGDGVQNGPDTGIANVTIRLYEDANGDGNVNPAEDALRAILSTSSTGSYSFAGLPADDYIVAVDTADPDFPIEHVETLDPDGIFDDKAKVALTGTRSDVDFGYQPVGSSGIGNMVWIDIDNDGQRDAGEPGIPGVTIQLYQASQSPSDPNPIATATTGVGGAYSFSNLPAGSYELRIPASNFGVGGALASYPWSSTVTNTSDDSVDNDDNGIQANSSGTVTSPVIALGVAESDDTKDFGFTAPGTVGDFVFFDTDGNASQDFNEVGIPNVTVRIYADAEDTDNDGSPDGNGVPDGAAFATVVSADGSGLEPVGFYRFTNVPPGNYIVRVDTTTLPQSGGNPIPQTSDPDLDGIPVDGVTYIGDHEDWSVLVFSGADYSSADFGYQAPGSIGDFVWLDVDGDSVQDVGEPGLANVVLEITAGSTVHNVTTDVNGYWSQSLADGTWSVSVVPANFQPGGALLNYAPQYDADGTATPNATSITIDNGVVTLPSPLLQGNMGIDFGYRLGGAYSVSGTVAINDALLPGTADDVDDFFDDGQDLDAGADDETELEGVEVFLFTAGGTPLGSIFTDANGDYTFTGLAAGSYRVTIGTTAPPLDNAVVTTTTENNLNGFVVTPTATSVSQAVIIGASSVQDVDFTFDSEVDFDYGDLPGAYGMTTLAQDGARHIIPSGGATVYLGNGAAPDAEVNGLANATATGDDASGTDDENGIVATPLAWTNGPAGGSVDVSVSGTGYLVAWVDWNNDKDFLDAGEFIINQPVAGGTSTINFNIPAGTIGATSQSWLARFRLFTSTPAFPVFSYEGQAVDGEVEDYLFERTIGGSIGDMVWADANGNGVIDGAETGIVGRLVELRDSTDAVVASQTTGNGSTDVDGDGVVDPAGYYRFRNVPAGDYSVVVTNPPAGFNPGFDEDGISTPNVSVVALAADTQHLTADFGYQPQLADISGTVYFDTDTSLDFSGADSGAAFVRVQLFTDPNGDGNPADGIQIRETFTNAAGDYSFNDVPTGTYVVVEINPPGADSVTDVVPPNDDRVPVVLAGSDVTDLDFLDTTPQQFAVTGTVYEDNDSTNDNVIGVGDRLVAGVTIELFLDRDGNGLVNAGDTPLAVTITASNGSYSFGGLVAGDYVVREIDPLGAVSDWDAQAPLADNQIGVTLSDSDVAGQDFLDDGAGSGVIGNLVWVDFDADGLQDAGEPGLVGVTVNLLDGSGNPALDDAGNAISTVSDASGAYSFGGLLPGSYQVQFVLLSGYLFSTADADSLGLNGSANSDADRTTGITPVFSLAPAETNGNVDAGQYPRASIAGTVFNDLNRLQDNTVNGTGTNAGGLFVNLLDATSSQVLASLPVAPDGTFTFGPANGVDVNSSYLLVLTTALQSNGAVVTAASLPISWSSVGEFLGAGPGHDGTANSILAVTTTEGPVADANLGIDQAPDVTPIITAIPNIMRGPTDFAFVIRVSELHGIETNAPKTIRVPKDVRWTMSGPFDPNLTEIAGTPVSNSVWVHSEDESNHIFTTTSVIQANGFTSFGFQARWDAGQTRGVYTATSQIDSGSGGEDRVNNNVDAEKIDYFID